MTQPAGREVLEARARALAQPRETDAAPVDTTSLLVFSRGGTSYGIEAARVAEVFQAGHATPVPATPPAIAGVVNHRGLILALVDVGALLSESTEAADGSWVIVLDVEGARFGIQADSVSGVVEVEEGELLPPDQLAERDDRVVRALTTTMVSVLDVEAVARDRRVEVDDEVE